MANNYYMSVAEVATELGVSKSYAYKLVHTLNEELKAMGCLTLAGKVDRRFFHEKIYAARPQEGENTIGSI